MFMFQPVRPFFRPTKQTKRHENQLFFRAFLECFVGKPSVAAEPLWVIRSEKLLQKATKKTKIQFRFLSVKPFVTFVFFC